ncbi:UDP-glucosyltransferase 2-like [Epargyreus clarus]|uniref:UDP-glucosyltransferase 2-like n=1 Tax=Epargyreus clarus TaxID=520877 RepID=UPI003C2F4F44
MVKWNSVKALNILGVFPNQEQSHWFMYEKYLQYLAKKGHNLTVITHFPQEEVIPNYYDVDLGAKNKVTEEVFATKKTYWMTLKVMDYVVTSGIERCKEMLENESVQELWKSKRKFDLVVMDYFNGDCGLALAYKLGAPVIGVTSELFPWHYRTFGIPFNPSYVPFTFIDSFKPTLYKRVESTVLDYIFNLKYENAQREHEHILSKYFGDLPPLKELIRGIKFLLLYQNFVLSGSRLLPPNVIEVGGYHEMPTKPLPAVSPILYYIFVNIFIRHVKSPSKVDAHIKVSKIPIHPSVHKKLNTSSTIIRLNNY